MMIQTPFTTQEKPQMYKYYYIINLCLFLQNLECGGLRLFLQFGNLFGSTGHNFYHLNNEVVKTPEVIVSCTSIKQEHFSRQWFSNAYSTGLVL